MGDEEDCQEDVNRFLDQLSSALETENVSRVLSVLRALGSSPRPPLLEDVVVQGMELLLRAGQIHGTALSLVAAIWDSAARQCRARDLVPILLAAIGMLAGELGPEPHDPTMLLLTHLLRTLGTLIPRVQRGGAWVAHDVAALLHRVLTAGEVLHLPACEACERALSAAWHAAAPGSSELRDEVALAGAMLVHATCRSLPGPACAPGPVPLGHWAGSLVAAWGVGPRDLVARLLRDPPGGLPALIGLCLSHNSAASTPGSDAGAAVVLALGSRLFGGGPSAACHDAASLTSFATVLAAAARLLRPGCSDGLLALTCLALTQAATAKGRAASAPWEAQATACITALHSPMPAALAPLAARAATSVWSRVPQVHQAPVLRCLLHDHAPPAAVRGGLTLLLQAEHPSLRPLSLAAAMDAGLAGSPADDPGAWVEVATLQASLLLRQALRAQQPDGHALDPSAARRQVLRLRRQASILGTKAIGLPLERLRASLDWALEALEHPRS